METLNISGRICHALINGADFPTVYWGRNEEQFRFC